jgi:hypothetical protein
MRVVQKDLKAAGMPYVDAKGEYADFHVHPWLVLSRNGEKSGRQFEPATSWSQSN